MPCALYKYRNDRRQYIIFVYNLPAVRETRDEQAKSAPQVVYDALRDLIIRGVYEGGQPLRQDELAARFGVSRIPVREALRQLEAEGLVAYEANRGAVVSSLSLADALEMLDIRIALEGRAMRLAVPNMTDDDLSRIGQLIDAYGKARKPTDAERLNRDLHIALYAPCDRPRLLALIRDNFDNASRFTRVRVSLATGRERPHREHEEIFQACRAGEADRAGMLLEAHLAYSQKALVAAIRRGGGGKG